MQELIEEFNQGKQTAFTTIYDRYWSAIFYFVRKFISDTAQAEDITAETFIKLWNARLNFHTEKNIASFLHTTARNASIDWLRAEKRQLQNKTELLHLLEGDAYNDLQEDVKTELFKLVEQEVNRLPSKIKEVFLLAYVEGKTNEEIAQSLGINNQSVRNHKARGLKLLRLAITNKDWLYMFFAVIY